MTTKINFKITTKLQLIYNDWERRLVPVRFAGHCVVCGRTTYQTRDENGHWHDPDPRGMVGDLHSGASLEARDYDMSGNDIPVCWHCRDNAETYRKALSIAKSTWKAANENQ